MAKSVVIKTHKKYVYIYMLQNRRSLPKNSKPINLYQSEEYNKTQKCRALRFVISPKLKNISRPKKKN